MADLTIDEKCGCGAEFHYRGRSDCPNAAKTAAAEWRQQHRHLEPSAVGICGHGGHRIEPEGITPICDLPASHAGWHEDRGRGSRWGHVRWTTEGAK